MQEQNKPFWSHHLNISLEKLSKWFIHLFFKYDVLHKLFIIRLLKHFEAHVHKCI